jgi:hypothetical protein
MFAHKLGVWLVQVMVNVQLVLSDISSIQQVNHAKLPVMDAMTKIVNFAVGLNHVVNANQDIKSEIIQQQDQQIQ